MLVCEEPQKHGDFEGKVHQVRRTHTSSRTSAMEPSASPSPGDAVWCRGVLPWGQRSTALNRAWSPCSASMLPPDTVGTQAPRVMGHCPAGTRCPCSTCSSHRPHCPQGPRHLGLLAPPHVPHCPQRSQASGNTCSTPPVHHGPRCPGTLLTSPCSPLPWTQVSGVLLHPTLHTAPKVSGRTVEVEVLADQGLRKDPQVTGDGSRSGVLEGQTERSLCTPLQLLKQRQILCAQLGHGGTHQRRLVHQVHGTAYMCMQKHPCPAHAHHVPFMLLVPFACACACTSHPTCAPRALCVCTQGCTSRAYAKVTSFTHVHTSACEAANTSDLPPACMHPSHG